MIFGNSRGTYRFPDRDIVDSYNWINLCKKAKIDSYGCPKNERGFYGFDNDVFAIRPYWWGDCTCGAEENNNECHAPDCALVLPNFLYKPTRFEIQWYKYPFRDSYMNQNLSQKEILNIFDKCAESIGE